MGDIADDCFDQMINEIANNDMDIDEETSEEYRPSIKSKFIQKFRHELYNYYITFEDTDKLSYTDWAESLDLETLKEIVADYIN